MPNSRRQRKEKNPRILHWLVELPRLTRIIIAVFFSLTVIAVIFPVVDSLYIQFFFTENTRIVPSYVTAGVGLVMYLAGWYLIVGTVGEVPPIRRAIVWYLAVGVSSFILLVLLIIQGIVILNQPL